MGPNGCSKLTALGGAEGLKVPDLMEVRRLATACFMKATAPALESSATVVLVVVDVDVVVVFVVVMVV